MVNVLVDSLGKIYTDSTGKALSVSGGGGSATLITKTIIENGTYNASSDSADGYSSVTVNVANPSIGTISITENGTFDVTNYANAEVNISGGTPSGTTDVPLTRISDDNGNEIGTWYMNFEDGSGNIFKVILLDAQYRNSSTQWCSSRTAVTNMPIYTSNYDLWWYDNAKETATQNTQLILDYCSEGSFTSTSCSHCRSQSFTINGTTYYGQFPNMREVFDMWRHRIQIEQMDTSASSYTSTNFSSARYIWSSNQCTTTGGWYFSTGGSVGDYLKTYYILTCPVLEIPVI